MLREVHLGGRLGKRYGRVHRFDISTPAEALRALEANHPGFMSEMLKMGEQGYGYRILHGKGFKHGLDNAVEVAQPCSGPIRIQPEIAGAKKGGLGQILAAVAIVVAAIYAPQLLTSMGMSGATAGKVAASMMGTGIAMGIGGVIQLLSPQQGASTPDEDKKNPSYVFDGPINTMAQGHPVPVGYGELIVGSAVISAGIEVTEEAIEPSLTGQPTYTDGEGNQTAYPPPTLAWDHNVNNWRLPNGTLLTYDETWNAGTESFVRTNFRTADGRVPTLSATPPSEPRYDIPSADSFATWKKAGSSFYWYFMGGVKIEYSPSADRWEIPASWENQAS